MAESKIEWTHYTHNPWWGCTKISPACKHCYAESFAKRTGHAVWGEDAPRRFFGEKHHAKPLYWNAEAERVGERRRVFCASMADVFECLPGHVGEQMNQERARLWRTIEATPALDWMLLTKRPEHFTRMLPARWSGGPPSNVWLGVTAENQEEADRRIPILLATRAAVHFISAEPLLGPINFSQWFIPQSACCGACVQNSGWCPSCDHACRMMTRPDLVIVGAEQAARPRLMEEQWVRSLRDQCARARVAFFYKQALDEKKRKVSLPLLDGRSHAEMPR